MPFFSNCSIAYAILSGVFATLSACLRFASSFNTSKSSLLILLTSHIRTACFLPLLHVFQCFLELIRVDLLLVCLDVSDDKVGIFRRTDDP